jgi:hypothetical protein
MRPRSYFWPLVLIGAGVVWLLVELGKIPVANLWALANLVPYLLLALGVALILRTRWPAVYPVISALVVAGMLLAILFAPQLGWATPPSWGWSWGDVQSGGSVPGSGVITVEARPLADFSSVIINYPAEVEIEQGATPSVTLRAENNLLPQIGTRVSGGALTIDNEEPNWAKRVNPSKPVQVTITVKDLQDISFPSAGSLQVENLKTQGLRISLSGAGDITLVGLNASSLNMDMSGAGSVHASGQVSSLYADISGLGSYEGKDLSSQTAQVDISGAGNATVWVVDQLTAQISGLGSVDYYGTPQIQKDVSGLGSVTSLGSR